MAGRNCCNVIITLQLLINNFDSVINKCQTGVMPTTCYSPTDAIRDWTLCTQEFYHEVFLRGWCICIQSVILRGFLVCWLNIFSSVNKNAANIIGEIFLSKCCEWQSFIRKFASVSFGSLRFFSTNISQGSVVAHLRCGGIYNYHFSRNLLLRLSVKKFLKIG